MIQQVTSKHEFLFTLLTFSCPFSQPVFQMAKPNNQVVFEFLPVPDPARLSVPPSPHRPFSSVPQLSHQCSAMRSSFSFSGFDTSVCQECFQLLAQTIQLQRSLSRPLYLKLPSPAPNCSASDYPVLVYAKTMVII